MHHDELNSGGELIPEVEPSVAAQQPSAENRPGLAFKFPERLQAWGRWMLAGNPFYPLSAGWLLYGLFLLNTDARFLGGDNQRLWFTFGSLELYELALVGAGLGLARLALWYDAAMLVILEDLLVLTPFILLSQAVLVDSGEAVIISGLGLALVGVRRWSLRRWFSRLNHPGRLLLMGACLLGVNVALPFIFRIPALQEDSATRAPFAEVVLPLLWNYWLPVVMLVANLLARPTNRGEIEPEKSWLPLVTAGLWTAGTGVHLAATGYVYSVVWQLVWLIPVLWAGAWTLQHRLGDFTLNPSRPMQALTLALPLLLTLLAADQPHITLFWQLNLLNASLYGLIWGRRPENRAAWELGILAAALVVAGGLVDPVWSPLASWRGHDVLVPGWLVYTVARGFLSRQPAWSLAASVALTVGLLAASSAGTMAVHPALHYGLVVFMLHSLFWSRTISLEANWGRRAVALVWVLHSLGWMNENGLPAIQFVLGTSGLLLAVCGAVKWLNGIPFPWFLLVSAASVWLAGCVGWLRQNQAEHLPGMGALVLSLVLFAAGTLLALSREKWGLTWPRSKANEP